MFGCQNVASKSYLNQEPIRNYFLLQIFRKKNLLTMTVDGKSNMKIGKKAGTDFALKDPMVIGKPDKLSVNDELNKLGQLIFCNVFTLVTYLMRCKKLRTSILIMTRKNTV